MWRGRYQLGQECPIGLLVTDASGTPTAPTAAPTAEVFGPTGTLAFHGSLPALDRYGTTGLFQHRLFLGSPFAAGLYRVVYSYVISGTSYGATDTFEVVPGGDQGGTVQSLHWHHRPHGEFLIQQNSSGSVSRGRNPTL